MVFSERLGERARCPKGSPGFKAGTLCAPDKISLLPQSGTSSVVPRECGLAWLASAGRWLSLAFTGCAR